MKILLIVPNIETHNDTSLIEIQIDLVQALADLKRLGELIHSRQPEECAAKLSHNNKPENIGKIFPVLKGGKSAETDIYETPK